MTINIETILIGDVFADDFTNTIVKVVDKIQQRYAPPVLVLENTTNGKKFELGSYQFSKEFRYLQPKHYFVSYAYNKGFGSVVFTTTDGELEQEEFIKVMSKEKNGVVIINFQELSDNQKRKFLLSREAKP